MYASSELASAGTAGKTDEYMGGFGCGPAMYTITSRTMISKKTLNDFFRNISNHVLITK
jgi:hypothetical protein